MSRNKRQSRYVDPKVQGALVRRFLFHWAAFMLTSFALLFVWQLLVSGDPIRGVGTVWNDIWTHNMPVFVTLVVLLPVLVLDTIKLSNRFAGPVVRLREALRDVADGREVEPLSFRQNDFWRDLPEIFNRAVERTGHNQTAQASQSEVEAGA